MTDFIDRDNTFEACTFVRADLRGSSIGYLGSLYQGCNFDWARLAGASFIRPRFVRCSFKGHFREVDFGASSFRDCKFSGRLEGGWFRNGFQHPELTKEFGKAEINRMDGVDFTDAVLWGVSFSGDVDLSNVKLPADGQHVLFKDWPASFERVRRTSTRETAIQSALEGFVEIFAGSARRQHHYILNTAFVASVVGAEGARFVIERLTETD